MGKKINGKGLMDIIFSWSFEDVRNGGLMKGQVPAIPNTFDSVSSYLASFVPALVEETRAELSSGIDTFSSDISLRIVSFVQNQKFKNPTHLFYDAVFHPLSTSAANDVHYGDVIAFSAVKPTEPEDISRSYVLAVVVSTGDGDAGAKTIISSKVMEFRQGDDLFAVRLGNITTGMRIWEALSCEKDVPILNNVIKKEKLSHECAFAEELFPLSEMSTWHLNQSQKAAVMNGLEKSKCFDGYSVNLIWGPPGTGKTATLACMLSSLLKLQRRTLACAPTNVAVKELSSRLLRSLTGPYGLGDILLFGNQTRLNVEDGADEAKIFLDHRVDTLMGVTNPSVGWRNSLDTVVLMLKRDFEEYEYSDEETKLEEKKVKRFLREKLLSEGSRLRSFLVQICTHLPTRFLSADVADDMMRATHLLQRIDRLVRAPDDPHELRPVSRECVDTLTRLPASFPLTNNEFFIKRFCFENACVLFSTVSGSEKLIDAFTKRNPIHVLIIDEAAQLRECESVIPMRIREVRHAFLVGNEQQLEAMVQSEVSKRACLGRSMFERMVKLGNKKHLLNVQYRMHPSISVFPVSKFYGNLVSDGANVQNASYRRDFLEGKWCMPYSFINVRCGREEMKLNSNRNMAEVAAIEEIVSRLCRAEKSESPTIGVISPYIAQVKAIERSLEKYKGFEINVKTVDGFQGGEEDIIILSTVRTNLPGKLGFLPDKRRTNVAITRAPHCLWIIGDGATLSKRNSIWREIVIDSKSRGCFHDAKDDKGLSLAISLSAIENGETAEGPAASFFLGLLRETMLQLQKLAYGWRNCEMISNCERGMVNGGKIADETTLLWTVDIARKGSWSCQVLKVWDISTPKGAAVAAKNIQSIINGYPKRRKERCRYILTEKDLVIPMRWDNKKGEELNCMTTELSDFIL